MSKTTQTERISKVLREQGGRAGWHGLEDFAPRDRYTLRNRVSELNAKGWNIISRRQKGKRTHEYRFGAIA